MAWVEIKSPPHGCTLLVRSGAALFFAAYSEWQEKWFHLHNGTETEIEAPEFYWKEGDVDATGDNSVPIKGAVTFKPETAPEKQLSLPF